MGARVRALDDRARGLSSPCIRARGHRARHVVACLLIVAALCYAPALAQQVLFTSDRYDPTGIFQSELYRYEAGSEIRVTDTPGWAEFDPVPSPDGDLYAAAATNFLPPVTSFDDDWSWRYAVYAENGRQVDGWDVVGSGGQFRPAGGFQIAWLPDGRSFLAIAYGEGSDWIVNRYVLDSRQTILLGSGYEVELHPDGERFATSHHGIVYLVEIATGERTTFAGGRPLGWTPDGSELIFEQAGTLYRAPADDPEGRRIVSDVGPYVTLRYHPSGERYAVAAVAGEASSVYFHAADHELIRRWEMTGTVVALDWLTDDGLIVEMVDGGGRRLDLLSVDGTIAPFVDSIGDDSSPRALH